MSEETKLLAEIAEICTEGQWTDGSGHLWGLISRIAAVAKKASAPAAGGKERKTEFLGRCATCLDNAYSNAKPCLLGHRPGQPRDDSECLIRQFNAADRRRADLNAEYEAHLTAPVPTPTPLGRRAKAGAGVTLTAEERKTVAWIQAQLDEGVQSYDKYRVRDLLTIIRRLTAQGGSDA
jgi:hypothetical protein